MGQYTNVGDPTYTTRYEERERVVKRPMEIIKETKFVPMKEIIEVPVMVEVEKEVPVFIEAQMTKSVEI